MQAWHQIYTPLGSLGLSAFVAAIPIIFFFVALAALRLKCHVAAAITARRKTTPPSSRDAFSVTADTIPHGGYPSHST